MADRADRKLYGSTKVPSTFILAILLLIILLLTAVGVIQGSQLKLITGDVVYRAPGACEDGRYRCSDDVLQTCSRGAWRNQEVCVDGCRDNACVADTSCTEESYRCLGDYRQRCISGSWTNDERCSAGCVDGRCTHGDQCQAGAYRCSGSVMQSCVYGTWFNKARCTSGCKGDACAEFISKRSCTDEDKGKDYFRRAETYGVDRHGIQFSKTDRCVSDKDLVEYSCQDGYLLEDRSLCPGRCGNGACVTEEIAVSTAENVPHDVLIEELTPLPAEPVTGRIDHAGFWTRMWGWLRGFFAEIV